MGSYVKKLDQSFVLREPVIRSAIHALAFLPGSQGLDVGCGIGNITALLAESVVPNGHVTGVDISPEMVAHAKADAKKAGMAHYLSFRQGDMRELPFDDNAFDWVWSMDCAGYAPLAPMPLFEELARVTKPGGRIAILAWSSQQLLPGYPELEAKLNATSVGIAPFSKGSNPSEHFLRSLGAFQQLGLQSLTAQTFVGSVHAPLSDDLREAMIALIEMRWLGAEAELIPKYGDEFHRLCQPASADFILNLPDYCAFFTYSIFQGMVAEQHSLSLI